MCRRRNIVLPSLQKEPRTKAYITNLVILNEPDDCERIARTHLAKQPFFRNNGFKHSLISTDDNDLWRKQREHFNEAFLPNASLAKVLPVTLRRATHCAKQLMALAGTGTGNEVDVSDFLLHETEAQLQLAMFGTCVYPPRITRPGVGCAESLARGATPRPLSTKPPCATWGPTRCCRRPSASMRVVLPTLLLSLTPSFLLCVSLLPLHNNQGRTMSL